MYIGVGGAVVIDDRESLPDRVRLKLLVADLRRHLRNLTIEMAQRKKTGRCLAATGVPDLSTRGSTSISSTHGPPRENVFSGSPNRLSDLRL